MEVVKMSFGSILLCILAFAVGIALLPLLFKLLGWSMKTLVYLIINAVLGVVLLIIFNLVGGIFGILLPINFLTVLVSAFLGIPGLIILFILFAIF